MCTNRKSKWGRDRSDREAENRSKQVTAAAIAAGRKTTVQPLVVGDCRLWWRQQGDSGCWWSKKLCRCEDWDRDACQVWHLILMRNSAEISDACQVWHLILMRISYRSGFWIWSRTHLWRQVLDTNVKGKNLIFGTLDNLMLDFWEIVWNHSSMWEAYRIFINMD